tara:strand:+ start:471 stop:1250 length:780 start_codon:yes stop_codon:yes gene_type:complete
MSLQITFTGKNSQIGEYIKGDYNFVSYDLMSPDTWKPLLDSDIVFLLLPKTKDTLEMAKKFTVSAMDSNIKQIVKIGSLGPWRLVHNQIDKFILESGIAYTSFDIAPLMNNIFTEQYIKEDKTLLDYRDNAPAPYLDPVCLASAIEQSFGKVQHYNKNYKCTGEIQYTITDIKDILIQKGYPVQDIKNTTNNKLHKLTDSNPDSVMMDHIGNRYKTEGWFPLISDDLKNSFQLEGRSFKQFITDDQHIFEQRLENDDCL